MARVWKNRGGETAIVLDDVFGSQLTELVHTLLSTLKPFNLSYADSSVTFILFLERLYDLTCMT